MEESEIYSVVGEHGFQQLVREFYRQVPHDDILGRLYPPNDLEGAEERLCDFLIFRFGGPQRYIEQRGHPRLRMRHAPFVIGPAARDHWLKLMYSALEKSGFPAEAREILWSYFTATAEAMMNHS